jgi:hypothetical protein
LSAAFPDLGKKNVNCPQKKSDFRFGSRLGPLLDLVIIAIVRQQRVVGFFFGQLVHDEEAILTERVAI